jgi:predicted alpha/beta hydrolase family esterase
MTNPTRMTIDQPHTELYISESGHIAVKQECPMDDDQIIVIHPLFVPTLVEWLQQLAEEIKTAPANE